MKLSIGGALRALRLREEVKRMKFVMEVNMNAPSFDNHPEQQMYNILQNVCAMLIDGLVYRDLRDEDGFVVGKWNIVLDEELDKEKMLEKSDYQKAVWAQTACNLSGIVFEFSELMKKICNESNKYGHGTDWKNQHPICRLFAEQIQHLTSKTDYFDAYSECEKGAGNDKSMSKENR